MKKFETWYKESGVTNMHFSWNYAGIAKQFGGKVIYDKEFGIFEVGMDFSENPDFDMDELTEHLAGVINRSLEAASKALPISNDTDLWGNMLDSAHPDYSSKSERLRHARLAARIDTGISSIYAQEFETQGILPVRKPEQNVMMASFIFTLTDNDIINISE